MRESRRESRDPIQILTRMVREGLIDRVVLAAKLDCEAAKIVLDQYERDPNDYVLMGSQEYKDDLLRVMFAKQSREFTTVEEGLHDTLTEKERKELLDFLGRKFVPLPMESIPFMDKRLHFIYNLHSSGVRLWREKAIEVLTRRV